MIAAWGRRLVTIPSFLLLALVSLLLAPLWIPAAALVDATRSGTRAALRCGLFFTLYLLCEAAGILASFALWLTGGPWTGRDRGRYLDRHFRLQVWWASTLFEASARIYGMRLEVEGQELVEKTPLLLLFRHTSIADTLLPALLVSRPHGTRLRYVLKRELLWDPCLDIVGNRLHNYFVDRAAEDGEREIRGVAQLLEGLPPDQGVMIYPEGTRFSPAKRARILERLRRRGDADLAARAERLRHVLPPRLGGTLALLEHNPGADAVFCAHTGFEGAATFGQLWHGALVDRRIRVCFWRVPYEEIPHDREARIEWLLDHWSRIDAWLERLRPELRTRRSS